jgi:hypothetical protein
MIPLFPLCARLALALVVTVAPARAEGGLFGTFGKVLRVVNPAAPVITHGLRVGARETVRTVQRVADSPVGRAVRRGADKVAAEAWGRAGSVGYPAAAALMYKNNGNGFPLTDYQKRKLRPLFGRLVDRVRVAYGSEMMEEWTIAGKTVTLAKPSGGQTFGFRIYLSDRYAARDEDQIELLAHELMHTRQYVRYGGTLRAFGYYYFKAFYLDGLDYASNRLEKEAVKAEEAYGKLPS